VGRASKQLEPTYAAAARARDKLAQHVLDYYPGDCTEEFKPTENRAREQEEDKKC